MSWVEQTLSDFGQGIGIDELRFNHDGVCCLVLENGGTLYFEKRDHTVLVYMAKEIPYLDNSTLKKAITLCHYKNNWPLPV